MSKELVQAIRDLIAETISMSTEGLVLSGCIKPRDLTKVRRILLENAQHSLDNALAFDTKNETLATTKQFNK